MCRTGEELLENVSESRNAFRHVDKVGSAVFIGFSWWRTLVEDVGGGWWRKWRITKSRPYGHVKISA